MHQAQAALWFLDQGCNAHATRLMELGQGIGRAAHGALNTSKPAVALPVRLHEQAITHGAYHSAVNSCSLPSPRPANPAEPLAAGKKEPTQSMVCTLAPAH